MSNNIIIYIACMAGITFLIRALPLTLIRKEIKNKTLRSFLYYVPYVTLAVMTFPAILSATQSPIAAAVALVAAIALAYFGRGLFFVAVSACVIVFVMELFTHPIIF
ncbi:MAG: AzlD domain-containing protein [Clostridia bacterium]|nr:AzlD domain-containing protein [Clostridia bacterium]